jgi:hypothetical protein
MPLLFTSGSPPDTDVAVSAVKKGLECRCFFHDKSGQPQRRDFTVRVIWVPFQNLPNTSGGKRPLLRCRRCGQDARRLFFLDRDLLCRACANVTYRSRWESKADRCQRIRIGLGGSGSLAESFPARPAEMSLARYERLRARTLRAEIEYANAMYSKALKLAARTERLLGHEIQRS